MFDEWCEFVTSVMWYFRLLVCCVLRLALRFVYFGGVLVLDGGVICGLASICFSVFGLVYYFWRWVCWLLVFDCAVSCLWVSFGVFWVWLVVG